MYYLKIALVVLISLSGWAGIAAVAQNLNFLNRAPIAQMTEADQDMLSTALNEALNDTADGEVVEWRNPETEAGGTITVLGTDKDYGTICRTLRTATEAGGRSGAGSYRLCLAEDQTWRFAPLRKKQGTGE